MGLFSTRGGGKTSRWPSLGCLFVTAFALALAVSSASLPLAESAGRRGEAGHTFALGEASLLVSIPQTPSELFRDHYYSLLPEVIRRNSWHDPYELRVPATEAIPLPSRGSAICSVDVAFKNEGGLISLGVSRDALSIQLVPSAANPQVIEWRMRVQLDAGVSLRGSIRASGCGLDGAIQYHLRASGLDLDLVTRLISRNGQLEVIDSVVSNLRLRGLDIRPSGGAGLIGFLGFLTPNYMRSKVNTFIERGDFSLLLTSVLSSIAPEIAIAFTDIIPGSLELGAYRLEVVSDLGHDSASGHLVAKHRVRFRARNQAACASELRNRTEDFLILTRPPVQQPFISVPKNDLSEAIFSLLQSGVLCSQEIELRNPSGVLTGSFQFQGDFRIRDAVALARRESLVQVPGRSEGAPWFAEIPVHFDLQWRRPGKAPLRSQVQTTASIPLQIRFDRETKRFVFQFDGNQTAFSALRFSDPTFAALWRNQPQLEQSLQSQFRGYFAGPATAFTPRFNLGQLSGARSSQMRFEPTQFVYTKSDLRADFRIVCEPNCESPPPRRASAIVEVASQIPRLYLPPDEVEQAATEQFLRARNLHDPGATAKGFLACPQPHVDHSDAGYQYGPDEKADCDRCVMQGSVWDYTLRSCVLSICAQEVSDGERSSCQSCQTRRYYEWSAAENRCGLYHTIYEVYAICRSEAGYHADRLPQMMGLDAQFCLACVGSGFQWNAESSQCSGDPRADAPRERRPPPPIIRTE